MPEKPTTAAGYPRDQVARVKATCLYLATKLGDLMPELVVVGGLVPSLLIDQQNLPANVRPHVGTMDLDLGLAFALVGEARYQEVAGRLRKANFSPDKNDEGQEGSGEMPALTACRGTSCATSSTRLTFTARTSPAKPFACSRKRSRPNTANTAPAASCLRRGINCDKPKLEEQIYEHATC